MKHWNLEYAELYFPDNPFIGELFLGNEGTQWEFTEEGIWVEV